MPRDYSLHARCVDPEDLLNASKDLAQSQRNLAITDLEDLLDRNSAYVRAVVNLGQELRMITEEDGAYQAHPNMALQLRQANTESEKQSLLKLRLHRYRPFIGFVKNLLDGGDSTQTARQVRVFYQLGSNVGIIEQQFIKLAEYTGILSQTGSGIEYHFETDLPSQNYFMSLGETLEDELVARLFLEKRLGEDIIAYIDEESFNELVVALGNFSTDPDDAIAAAGRAIETFQRQIGNDKGSGSIDYTGPDGIRQLAQTMASDKLSRQRHQLAGEYFGEVRNNTGGHGIDSDTGKHWTLTEEVAFGLILTAIHYIRSLYRWVVDDQLVV